MHPSNIAIAATVILTTVQGSVPIYSPLSLALIKASFDICDWDTGSFHLHATDNMVKDIDTVGILDVDKLTDSLLALMEFPRSAVESPKLEDAKENSLTELKRAIALMAIDFPHFVLKDAAEHALTVINNVIENDGCLFGVDDLLNIVVSDNGGTAVVWEYLVIGAWVGVSPTDQTKIKTTVFGTAIYSSDNLVMAKSLVEWRGGVSKVDQMLSYNRFEGVAEAMLDGLFNDVNGIGNEAARQEVIKELYKQMDARALAGTIIEEVKTSG